MTYLKHALLGLGVILLIALGFHFIGGGDELHASETGAAGGAPQAMPVQAQIVEPQAIQVWKNFSGHVVAVDRAVIRPQVSGRITDIRFEDGQHVEQGDTLIVIDPRPYEATLNQAKASLSAAQAQSSLAEKEYKRAKSLIETQSIAQRILDERINNRNAAWAAVKAAEALVESAEIDLDYANIKAPISGKISRAELTEGNLVEAGANAPLLTSIVSDENVYVDFEIDDQTYLNLVRHHNGSFEDVLIRVVAGDVLTFEGKVHSFDNQIDPATGTIRARALFENKDKALLPGMSVTVRMGANGDEEHIVISERAIGTDQDRKFVYIIDDEGKAAYREIKIGSSVNGSRIILSGLESGETIITEGIVKIRPGVPVAPQTGEASASEPAAEHSETSSEEESKKD